MAQTNEPKKMTDVTKELIRGVHFLIKKRNIQFVDVKFNNLPGLRQHFSAPELNGSADPRSRKWAEGIGFDGSSIRGSRKIQGSDMFLYLKASTAVVDPVCEVPALSIICDDFDPPEKQAYTRYPPVAGKCLDRIQPIRIEGVGLRFNPWEVHRYFDR